VNEMTDSKSSVIQPSCGIAAGLPNTGAYTTTKPLFANKINTSQQFMRFSLTI